MSVQDQGFRSFVRVLRNRDFFWLWLSQLISLAGDFFSFLAVPYLITMLADGEVTAATEGAAALEGAALSPEAKMWVGVAMAAFTAPRLLGIFTGAFVDRWDRHRTMITANLVAGAVVLLPLLACSLDTVWIIILMQLALALVSRFIWPTQQASVPLIVPKDDLLAANGLSSLTQTAGMIVGPLLAGLTVQFLGVKAAFGVDSATFLIAAAILRWKVRIPRLENPPTGSGMRAILDNIWEGVRFIGVTRLLLWTTICFAILQGGLGSINATWVPFLRETFGLGPIGITTVDTAQGIGMALGAVALGFLMARLSKWLIAGVGITLIGFSLAGIGAAPAFWFVLVMGFSLGVLLTPVQSAFNTLMQLSVPMELQGRVFSSFFAVTQAAGLLMIGVVTGLVTTVPLRAIMIGGGVITVVGGLLWTILTRAEALALERKPPAASEDELTDVPAAALAGDLLAGD